MATENNAIISVNQTSYDVQEDWLEVASKYFNINTADIYSDNDIQNSNIAYPNLESMHNMEIFKNPSSFNNIYTELWSEVKAADF